jgi:Putative gypsy type transposon
MESLPESSISASRLVGLAKKGFINDAERAAAAIPSSRPVQRPNDGEVVSFPAFHERGLGLPVHPFLRGLLIYYGLELHHLTPSGILHLAAFVTLCEAFMGIAPHFLLWKYFFHVRGATSIRDGRPRPTFGGAVILLRSGKGGDYFSLPLLSSNKGWSSEWFAIRNFAPELPAFSDAAPERRYCWGWGPSKDEVPRLAPILEVVAALKSEGLTGETLLRTFFSRRI